MTSFKKSIIFLSIILLYITFSGCYKDDSSILYSRQYIINNTNIEKLSEKLTLLNEKILSNKQLILSIKQQKVIKGIKYLPNKNNPISAGERYSVLVFNPTKEQQELWDFKIENWQNDFYGSPINQNWNSETIKLGGFYTNQTQYYSNACSADLYVSVKGQNKWIKVGTYSQTEGSTPNGENSTKKFIFDSNYPSKK